MVATNKKKHSFRVVKNFGKEDYDELSIEEKEKLWKRNISGSMVKNVVLQPKTTLLVKLGYIKPIKVGKSPLERFMPGFNKRSIEKTFWGNQLEEVILQGTNKMFYEHLNDGYIVFDKRTFRSDEHSRITANIDGFIVKKDKFVSGSPVPPIYRVHTLVENKNMEAKGNKEQDYDNVVDIAIDRYEYQIRFYMWFFNAKRGLLNILINGWKIRQVLFYTDLKKEYAITEKVFRFLNIITFFEDSIQKGEDEYDTLELCLRVLDWVDGSDELGADFNVLKTYFQVKIPVSEFVSENCDINKIKLIIYKYFNKK